MRGACVWSATPRRAPSRRFRDGAGDALRLALPEPEAGLAAGILVGLRERVDRSLAADFATAGVSHVVAISGWNIAIVAASSGRRCAGDRDGSDARRPRHGRGLRRRGWGVAVGRPRGGDGGASCSSRARADGPGGRRPPSASAAAVLLLAEPAMIGDAGFRLSVLATAGLLAWANPL